MSNVEQSDDMAESTIPIEIHADVSKSFAKEYVESVTTDGMKMLPSNQHRQDTLIVMNRRRVAVVLDKQAHLGAVIPFDLIEQVVEGPKTTKHQTWLAESSIRLQFPNLSPIWVS